MHTDGHGWGQVLPREAGTFHITDDGVYRSRLRGDDG